MKNNNKTLTMGVAFLLGVFCSFLWGKILIPKHATPQTINDNLTIYYIIYMAIAAIPISIFGSASPWTFGCMLVLGSYIAGLLFIPYFGQFGPFDMLFLFIFTIPAIIVALITRGIKTKIIKAMNA